MPNDGGNLLFTDEEKEIFLIEEPDALPWIKPLLSAEEFLNGQKRWCLWLVGIKPNELKKLPLTLKRIEEVKKARSKSTRPSTQNLASFPTLFGEIRQSNGNFILIPRHSSETRAYIPMGFFDNNYIASDSCSFIPNASLFLFGQLTSLMHMAWIKYVCGRIKSDFRYSNTIVYNNYPFPQGVTEAQHKKVEAAAQVVLNTRAKYPNSSLADLYDSLSMPPDLVKAHQALDKAVDLCYRPQPFLNELSRIEFLFGLYAQYTAPMFLPEKKKRGGKKKE